MSIECIRRKDSTRYRAVVRIGRKKISKTFQRKIDAKLWEARTGQGSAFVRGSNEASDLTVDELMSRFEVEHVNVRNAPSTAVMNRSLYDNYLKAAFAPVRLRKLTRQGLESYLLHLRNEKGLSNGRVNRVRQLLHVMLNRAVSWELLSTNPASRIERLPDKDYLCPEDIRFLSKSESEKLVQWLRINDPWLFPKIVILLHTGIRYGEMAALRVQDVRLSAVSRHLSIARSRCRHTGGFVLPKGKRARILPLSPGLANFMEGLVCGKEADAPVFWENWIESRWPTKADKHFRKALQKTGVNKITIHDLRHTFAVRFLENGGPVYTLKELLGHKDIKLTMRYSHFSPAMAEQARGIVDFHDSKPGFTVVDGGVRETMSHKSPTKHETEPNLEAPESGSVSLTN